jgi:hypothetical protein
VNDDGAKSSTKESASSESGTTKKKRDEQREIEILYKLMIEQQKRQEEQERREAKSREDQLARDARFQEQQLQLQQQTQQMLLALSQSQQQVNPNALLSLLAALKQSDPSILTGTPLSSPVQTASFVAQTSTAVPSIMATIPKNLTTNQQEETLTASTLTSAHIVTPAIDTIDEENAETLPEGFLASCDDDDDDETAEERARIEARARFIQNAR